MIEIIYFPKFRFFATIQKRSCGEYLVANGEVFAFSEFREEANLEGRDMLKKEEVSLWGGGC